MCHRRKKGGEWIWHTDLVESGGGVKEQRGANFHKPLTKVNALALMVGVLEDDLVGRRHRQKERVKR